MENISLWEAISKRTINFPTLNENLDVDVVIIGGGITGVTTADRLLKEGKTVAVVESYKIGGVTTGYSTGNLYIPVQPFYQSIKKKFNMDVAKQVAHSRKVAIDFIEQNILEKKIKCDFKRRPWYAYTKENDNKLFNNEVETFQQIGLEIIETHELPLPLKYKKAVMLNDQARFNPLQYVISMAEDLSKRGCLFFENSRVISVDEDKTCQVKTSQGKITAKKVLIATHTPIGINSTQMFTAPYRSYVVSVKLEDEKYPEGHYWGFDQPYAHTCTHAMNSETPKLLMTAGSHHKVGQEKSMKEHYSELELYLKQHFSVTDVPYKWSAQHYQAADDVPYIGLASRSAKNIYLATGFFADGLTYGTLAGMILGDILADKKNHLAHSYDPARLPPVVSLGFVVKENANVFLQYLKDYPVLEKLKFDDLEIGQGKICEINREKCAVSRDSNNQIHIVSAVCTHLKCIVNWNDAERTWDCPCHGSRFSQTGKVLEGPALLDLEKKSEK